MNMKSSLCLLIVFLFLLNNITAVLSDINIDPSFSSFNSPRIFSNQDEIVQIYSIARINGEKGLILSKSFNKGKTFTSKLIIEGLAISEFDSQIYKNFHYLTYVDNDKIFFISSNDGGNIFSSPKQISNNFPIYNPKIQINNNKTIFILWTEYYQTREIKLTISKDGGTIFTNKNIQINNNSVSNQSSSEIYCKNNQLFIVWTEDINNATKQEIFYIYSKDEGDTFTQEKKISNFYSEGSRKGISGSFDKNGIFYLFGRCIDNKNMSIKKFDISTTSFSEEIVINIPVSNDWVNKLIIYDNLLFFTWTSFESKNNSRVIYLSYSKIDDILNNSNVIIVTDSDYGDILNYDVTIWKYKLLFAIEGWKQKGPDIQEGFFITYLHNSPPNAIIFSPQENDLFYENQPIFFSANGSYDIDNDTLLYQWKSNVSGQIGTEHFFITNLPIGKHNITLLINDSKGQINSSFVVINVFQVTELEVLASKKIVLTYEMIEFTCTPKIDGVEYYYNFGDGEIINWTDSNSIIHEYKNDGNYTFKVGIKYQNGYQINPIGNITIFVINRPPIPIFTISLTFNIQNEFFFNSSDSYDFDGKIEKQFWNFGDGVSIIAPNPYHIYYLPGEYEITLIIYDDDGDSSVLKKYITIENLAPIADFTISSTEGTILTNFQFISESRDLDGTILHFKWDFGDGHYSFSRDSSHQYKSKGEFFITLTVIDNNNISATIIKKVIVKNILPKAQITYNRNSNFTFDNIVFNSNQSYDEDGIILKNFWYFDTGLIIQGIIIQYNFSNEGNYSVCLRVIDDNDASNINCTMINILNRAPIINISFPFSNLLDIRERENIVYSAVNSYDIDGIIITYVLEIENTSINRTEIVGSFSLNKPGHYRLILTVIDDDGDINRHYQEISVKKNKKKEINYFPMILLIISLALVTTIIHYLILKHPK